MSDTTDDRPHSVEPAIKSLADGGVDFKELVDLLFDAPPTTTSVATHAASHSSRVIQRFSERDRGRIRELETKIRGLQDQLASQARTLRAEQSNVAEHSKMVTNLSATIKELQKKQQLAFLVDRVSPEAASLLLGSEVLAAEFTDSRPRALFAMSVDIRRSTDLMLKARTPQAFASFITDLCDDLMDIVMQHHGVIDKFTGDGILCFYPEFFTGEDAGYLALAAADACHSSFERHYRERRSTFHSVLMDVGLGIGIDYGECNLVQVAGNLTIVGAPVVYACRLGGAPIHTTLLNQPAYETISKRHGGAVLLNETSIIFKHEGPMLAYSARLSRNQYQPKPPAWKNSIEKPL